MDDNNDNDSASSHGNVEIVTPEMMAGFLMEHSTNSEQNISDDSYMNMFMFTGYEAEGTEGVVAEGASEGAVAEGASEVNNGLQNELMLMITNALHIYLAELMDIISPQMFMTNIFTSLITNVNYDSDTIIMHMNHIFLNDVLHDAMVSFERELTAYYTLRRNGNQQVAHIDNDGNVVGEMETVNEVRNNFIIATDIANIANTLNITPGVILHMANNFYNQQTTENIIGREPGVHTLIDNNYHELSDKLKEQQECAICNEDYEPDTRVITLPCNHIFHNNCIIPWISEQSTKCPICHSEITQDGIQDEDGTVRYANHVTTSFGNGYIDNGEEEDSDEEDSDEEDSDEEDEEDSDEEDEEDSDSDENDDSDNN